MFLNQAEKVKTGFWSLNLAKISELFFYLLILFLPTQLGKHFWPNFSFVFGLRLDYLSPTFYFTDLLIILIFIVTLPKLITALINARKKYLLIFMLLVGFLLLGIVDARNYWAGIYGIIKFLEFSFLAYYVSQNYKQLNKTVLFSCFLLSIIFESLLACLQYINQGSLGGLFYLFGERTFNALTPGIANATINGQLFLRPYSTFSHPNVLAGFLVISMLLLFIFSFKKNTLKTFTFLGITIGTAALLLTLSRSAILVWLICLLVLFGLSLAEKYKKGKFNSLKIILPVIVVFIIGAFLFLQNNYIMQRFITTNLSDQSVVQRQELMSQSLSMFWKNPMVGVGVNNFYNNLTIITYQQKDYLIQPVHNIFLLVMSETGIIGLFFLSILFIKSAFKILKNKQNKKYLLLLIFVIIFLGMFDHYLLTLQQGQLLLSLVFGVIFAKS